MSSGSGERNGPNGASTSDEAGGSVENRRGATDGGSDEEMASYGSQIGERTSSLTRVKEWLLVDGNRLVIATGLSVAVFGMLLVLAEVGVISFVNDDSITRLAGGMIAGTFSLVTLVVSINQLILSREFAAAGETRERLDGVLAFRDEVADVAAIPTSPASPSMLLEVLVETIHQRAGALANAVDDHDEELQSVVSRYVRAIEERTERADETLEHTEFGTVKTVTAAVGYDDSWQLYVARHLKRRHRDELSDDAVAAFDDLIEALELFAIGQEHFKTTYLQRELTQFSQLTIYTGVPAILSAMLIGFLYADLTGATLSLSVVPFVVSALVAVVVSPLALLVTYILRTATITRRSASTGPMVPQKGPEEGPFEVPVDSESESPIDPDRVSTDGGSDHT